MSHATASPDPCWPAGCWPHCCRASSRPGPSRSRTCRAVEAVGPGADGRIVEPWSVELDAEGVVAEHRITFEREGARTTLRTGPRGFSLLLGPRRVLVGERSDAGTDLAMIDIPRACRLWTRHVDRLAYPYAEGGDRRQLRLSLHRPDTRRFDGDLALDVESGDSDGMIDGICLSECEPHDGDLSLAAYEPAGAARPVPSFAAGGWPQDKKLTFRWGPGAVPPALGSGAADIGSGRRRPHLGGATGPASSIAPTPPTGSATRAPSRRTAAAAASPVRLATCPRTGASGCGPTAPTSPGARCAGARSRTLPVASTSGASRSTSWGT